MWWERAWEWLVRRASARGVSQPRWRQSRSPFSLPGPLVPSGYGTCTRTQPCSGVLRAIPSSLSRQGERKETFRIGNIGSCRVRGQMMEL